MFSSLITGGLVQVPHVWMAPVDRLYVSSALRTLPRFSCRISFSVSGAMGLFRQLFHGQRF